MIEESGPGMKVLLMDKETVKQGTVIQFEPSVLPLTVPRAHSLKLIIIVVQSSVI